MRIWRDIPSPEYLLARLQEVSKIDRSAVAGPRTIEILKSVESYHRIRKDAYGYLDVRKSALEGIKQKVTAVVRTDRTQAGVKNRMGTGTTLDSVLDALGRRAAAKAKYIGILLAYYGNNQDEALNPATLITMLDGARPENPDTLELWPNERLEKRDPLHRDWTGGWSDERAWRAALERGETSEPLFVWLEASEHCLSQEEAKRARTVVYFTEEGTTTEEPLYWLRFPGNGMVEYAAASREGAVWKMFDTNWVTRQVSIKGGHNHVLAYNWTRGGEVLACVHNSLQIDENRYGHHHSSMTGGEVVRCAGMIGGVGGKITWVDTDSGHYQTRKEHLFRFVRFLSNRGVLSPDAQIEYYSDRGPKVTEAAQAFLGNHGFQGANAQNGVPRGNFIGGRGNG